MKSPFSRLTFRYFDLAKKNKKKKVWFEKNRALYLEGVKEPFTEMIREMQFRLGDDFPDFAMSPRKISRPLRPEHKAKELGHVKAGAMFYFSEKMTSMFEWNPGLYLHLGDEKDDNVIGIGLFGPTGRQTRRLREALVRDYEEVAKILADRKLKKYWGGLADERYRRFPKAYAPDHPAAEYLWYRQFFLRRRFTRKEVLGREFPETMVRAFAAAAPFLHWVRKAVGVYDRLEALQEKRDREMAAEEARL